MPKHRRNLFRLVYNDLNKKVQRTLADNLNTYEEAILHKQYYRHLGYSENNLDIEPFFDQKAN